MTDIVDEQALELGKKLQRIRMRRGYNGKRFAAMAGVNPVSLSQWEHGKNLRSVIKFVLVCQKLGIPLEELLED